MQENFLGGVVNVSSFDCGDGVKNVLHMSKLIKWYTSIRSSSLYINYTSVMLLQNNIRHYSHITFSWGGLVAPPSCFIFPIFMFHYLIIYLKDHLHSPTTTKTLLGSSLFVCIFSCSLVSRGCLAHPRPTLNIC